jgi:hypothetical protein
MGLVIHLFSLLVNAFELKETDRSVSAIILIINFFTIKVNTIGGFSGGIPIVFYEEEDKW